LESRMNSDLIYKPSFRARSGNLKNTGSCLTGMIYIRVYLAPHLDPGCVSAPDLENEGFSPPRGERGRERATDESWGPP
jgi:hypothetical protein